MTRKDSDKDSERPHYYSQFWLDVAAGRRTIGGPKPNEDAETAEVELPEVAPQRRGGRASDHEIGRERAAVDGRVDNIVHPVAEPVASDDYVEPEPEDLDLAPVEEDEVDYQDTAIEDEDIPDMDLSPVDEEEETEDEEDEDFFDDEVEEEEDEEDLSWGRGRKKAKPGRQTKQPPKKPIRRDRRGGY